MKSKLTIIFLFIFVNSIFAQRPKIDSLEILLQKSSEQQKAKILNDLGAAICDSLPLKAIEYCEKANILSVKYNLQNEIYRYLEITGKAYTQSGNYEKALSFFQKLLTVLKEKKEPDLICSTLNYIGNVYDKMSKYDQAIENYKKSLKIAEETENKKYISYALNNLGSSFMDYGKNDEALSYFMKSLKIKESLNDKKGIANTLNNIGILFTDMKKSDIALEYLNKALNVSKEISNKNIQNLSLCNIGNVYSDNGDFRKALQYYFLSMRLSEELNDLESYASNLTNIGNNYYNLKMDDSALVYFIKSLEVLEKLGNTWNAANTTSNIGRLFLSQKKYDNAYPYLTQSLHLAKEVKSLLLIRNCYDGLSKYYELKSDFHNALENQQLYSVFNDSVFNLERDKKISELQTKYETEKKESQINTQKILISHKNSQIRNLLIGISIIILLLVAILVQYLMKYRAYLQIVKQNLEIIRREKEQHIYNVSESKIEIKEEKRTTSNLPDEQRQILFNAVTEAMEKQGIYKEKDLTIEKLASHLNTNRSYLSKVINDLSGLSFSNYLNKYRIDEALRILSDTQKNVPVKLLFEEVGFNSMNAFYESFKKIVGVTPSFFRKSVIKISDNQNNDLTD